MYLTKEDLIGVSDEDIKERLENLMDKCRYLDDELKLVHHEVGLLLYVENVRNEEEALLEFVDMAREDKKEGRVYSSAEFKDKLKKRREELREALPLDMK
jgi:hypothetical protein